MFKKPSVRVNFYFCTTFNFKMSLSFASVFKSLENAYGVPNSEEIYDEPDNIIREQQQFEERNTDFRIWRGPPSSTPEKQRVGHRVSDIESRGKDVSEDDGTCVGVINEDGGNIRENAVDEGEQRRAFRMGETVGDECLHDGRQRVPITVDVDHRHRLVVE